MIDAMAVLIILGFIGTIGTTAGMAFWLDRKQSARMDRIEKRLDDQDVLQRAMQSELARNSAELEAQGERLDVKTRASIGLRSVSTTWMIASALCRATLQKSRQS